MFNVQMRKFESSKAELDLFMCAKYGGLVDADRDLHPLVNGDIKHTAAYSRPTQAVTYSNPD